jgi:hypothetical protein
MPFLFILTSCFSASKTTANDAGDVIEDAAAEQQLSRAPLMTERKQEDGLTIQELDFNTDGTPDVYNHFRERSNSRLLVKKEVDLNWDGKLDIRTFFDDSGTIMKEEMDGDFDGMVEWVDHYQGGIRVMSEIDTDIDGTFDLFRFYENEKVRRKEQDTNSDGSIDFWQYLDEEGNVTKTGRDLDGDGIMDERKD